MILGGINIEMYYMGLGCELCENHYSFPILNVGSYGCVSENLFPKSPIIIIKNINDNKMSI